MFYVNARQNITIGPWTFKHTVAHLRSKRPVSPIVRFSHERLIDPLNRILAAQNTTAIVLVKPSEKAAERRGKTHQLSATKASNSLTASSLPLPPTIPFPTRACNSLILLDLAFPPPSTTFLPKQSE